MIYAEDCRSSSFGGSFFYGIGCAIVMPGSLFYLLIKKKATKLKHQRYLEPELTEEDGSKRKTSFTVSNQIFPTANIKKDFNKPNVLVNNDDKNL